MEKFTINIDKSDNKEKIIIKINEVLLPILQWYDPKNHSDMYYIKIYISKILSLTIKWVMPFDRDNAKTYVIYSYITFTGTPGFEDMIFSSAIHNKEVLETCSMSIAKCIAEYTEITSKPDCIYITTNLDTDNVREQRGFKRLNSNKSSEEEVFTDFVYYLGQNLTEHINYAMMRLEITVDAGDSVEKGAYEIMIHCSSPFKEKIYDLSYTFPNQEQDSVFGFTFEELVSVLHDDFMGIQGIIDMAHLHDDEYHIGYYIIKQEVAY